MTAENFSVQDRLALLSVLVVAGLVVAGFVVAERAAPEESVKPGINDSYREPDVGQWVERFEREGREIYDRRDDIVAVCAIEPGSCVADIGAGTGLFVPLLSDAVGRGGTVYAVEIVPQFVAHLRDRAEADGLTNVEPVLCTERSVELGPHSIDVAFLCDVYHHLEYPKSSMTSLHRALRPGGTVVVVDFERIPGESSEWVLNHVRAGKETVRAEIESFGFDLLEDVDLRESNFGLRFRKR